MNPEGKVGVNSNGNVSISYTVDTGYILRSVYINGVEKFTTNTVTNPLNIIGITSNNDIVFYFKKQWRWLETILNIDWLNLILFVNLFSF